MVTDVISINNMIDKWLPDNTKGSEILWHPIANRQLKKN